MKNSFHRIALVTVKPSCDVEYREKGKNDIGIGETFTVIE